MATEKLISVDHYQKTLERFKEKLIEFGKVEAAEAVKTLIKGLKLVPAVDAVDVGVVKNHIKPKADSTLYNMRKVDLIEYIRTLEHNYNVAVSFNENQAKYVESLGVQPKWIPVSERLPDTQGTYLCRYGFGQFADYMTTGCIDWIAFDKHPHWQHASTGLFVTHWVPLPEPPEEVER